MTIEELRRRVAARESERISQIGQEAARRYLKSKERTDPIEAVMKFTVNLIWIYACLFIAALIGSQLF
jgi:hypothetical protein